MQSSSAQVSLTVFQSTRPLWGATRRHAAAHKGGKFQSTRPLWGATTRLRAPRRTRSISIHAPLVGRDAIRAWWRSMPTDFNPRAPCGARPHRHACRAVSRNFNPRAPCGARLMGVVKLLGQVAISIHAPLVGRDPTRCAAFSAGSDFNPRAPCGARLGCAHLCRRR